MADLNPVAGINDVVLSCVVQPPGAPIHGSAIGECIDDAGEPAALPTGYAFVEESQFVTRLVCPTLPDDIAAPDVRVRQKADADMSEAQAFLNAEIFSVKTIAPTAAALTSSASLSTKLP